MPRNEFDPVEMGDAELALEPQRTSIMAILSLICALICIIPGMGIVATILGVSAAIGISSSRGRVGGMGLAIAGIVLGLLFSMLWVGIAIGIKQGFGFFQSNLFGPGGQVMAALDSGDYKGARALFTPAADQAVSDDRLQAFRAEYQAELGSFKGVPQGAMELWIGYRDVAPMFQKLQGRQQNVLPLPGNFDKGAALIVFQLDPSGPKNTGGPPTPANMFPVVNIWIMTASGKTLEVLPTTGLPTTVTPPAPGAPPPAPTDSTKPPGNGG